MGAFPAEEQNLTAAEEAFQCAYRAGHYKAPYMVRGTSQADVGIPAH
jgi:hypothetical protein